MDYPFVSLQRGGRAMSKKHDRKSVEDRRDFLKLATVGTVLGGAAIAIGGTAQAAKEPDKSGSGYRESDHVKSYYKLARF
jgi:hypothetical protein